MDRVSRSDGIRLDHVRDWLEAEVLVGERLLDRPVLAVEATDMMSQVLAFAKPGTVLLTGLTNVQVVNTAEVAGLAGVVFVRGQRPPEAVIAKAEAHSLPLLLTPHSLYEACGLLHQSGVSGQEAP